MIGRKSHWWWLTSECHHCSFRGRFRWWIGFPNPEPTELWYKFQTYIKLPIALRHCLVALRVHVECIEHAKLFITYEYLGPTSIVFKTRNTQTRWPAPVWDCKWEKHKGIKGKVNQHLQPKFLWNYSSFGFYELLHLLCYYPTLPQSARFWWVNP